MRNNSLRVIDLTHTIESTMSVFPGTSTPVITQESTIERDNYAEKSLSFCSHTGTHIDAPSHIFENSCSLDKLTVDKFIGKAVVIDVSSCENELIGKELIDRNIRVISKVEFVLFYSGWDIKWGRSEYFEGFPTLSPEAAKYLCNFKLKGVGFDVISADPVVSSGLPNHKLLLGNGIIIVENLCNLDKLPNIPLTFITLPLKIAESDGAPARAVGIVSQF